MEFRYRGPKEFRTVQMDLIGELPVRYPMKITVILNKTRKNMIQIPAQGKYSFVFEFPDSENKDLEYSVEVISDKFYIPKKLKINDDERELSVILDSLTLIDNTSTPTQFIQKTI
jgi:hypothetical protein